MENWMAHLKAPLIGAFASAFIAGSAHANLWFEPTPVDAPTAAFAASNSIELAQSSATKTPAQLAVEEANKNTKKKKKNKKKKKRRGSFK
ncbi:hypothetical protein ROA7450_01775 [Roseovarius albus]|uniref:Uncharacterized protein n=1 Tax=Roseovarius albus TaxID=1247867 RepID=A0A1X6Z0X1_9RHOB|nr:hypothetical protein [Roseovarius albus]SLN37112.1 hypothetical protein ROA7450_01775 [Roseovarius albus]